VASYDPNVHKLSPGRRKELTARELRFVELFLGATGAMTMKDAAVEAGYPPKSAHAIANKLTNPSLNPHVVAYMQKRQRELAAKYGTSLERHMQDLMTIRDRAIEAGAWSAAVQAEYRRGQALGTIYVDRKEIRHGTIDSMSKEEVQRKLDELRKIYQASPRVVDVEDVEVVRSIDKERNIDKPAEEVLDEAGNSLLSEDEEGDEEDEDYPR
jgi:phage terminase small subunit